MGETHVKRYRTLFDFRRVDNGRIDLGRIVDSCYIPNDLAKNKQKNQHAYEPLPYRFQ